MSAEVFFTGMRLCMASWACCMERGRSSPPTTGQRLSNYSASFTFQSGTYGPVRYSVQMTNRQSSGSGSVTFCCESVPLVYKSGSRFCYFLQWLSTFKISTKNLVFSVLWIRDVYPGSRISIFSSQIPDPGSGSA
jgi:hypothetical protein